MGAVVVDGVVDGEGVDGIGGVDTGVGLKFSPSPACWRWNERGSSGKWLLFTHCCSGVEGRKKMKMMSFSFLM